MKPITLLLAAGSLLLSAQGLSAQTAGSGKKEYWNANTLLIPYRLPPAPAGYKPTYIDLDGDGDPGYPAYGDGQRYSGAMDR